MFVFSLPISFAFICLKVKCGSCSARGNVKRGFA